MAEAQKEVSEALQLRWGDEMNLSCARAQTIGVRQAFSHWSVRRSRQSRTTALQAERHHLGPPSGSGAP